MNILKKLAMATVLVLVQGYAVSASAALGYMRINFIETELQIKTPDAGEWGYAAINTPLDVGDEVWVPEGGRVELQLNSGSYIRLDGGTALQILSVDQDSSQVYLSQGQAYIYYDAPRGSVIQVDSPDVATRAFDRAIFNISVSEYYTDVTVYKGYAFAENRIGETRVNAGNMVSLGKDTNGEIVSIGYLDDWERWNEARDQRLYQVSESQSVRYLPSELRTYYSDFDSHGTWVHVHEYGYVWTPRTYISTSWTPYRHGRWIWRGGDYIWVAYEPWGWAPYHYGRWAFAVGVGWCWVPPLPGAVYWGPGYVGWVRTHEYVGWVPLAPGEIYYGRGYYGRDSVNITNVNINEIHFTNVYQNVNVHNGPIIVDQRSFHEGSQTIVHVDNNIRNVAFTQNSMIPGAPAVKPAKKGLFAVARDIPKDRLPPQHVKLQPVTELTKTRRLIRDEGKSVFNPDVKPANLPIKKAERQKGKGEPRLEKIQPMQREQLEQRPQSGGPAGVPAGKREKGQRQLDQQGKPMGPPEEGRGGGKKVEQTQREQLEQQPRPGGPEGVREGKREKGQMQPDQQGKPMGPPEEGRGGGKKVEQTQREQLEQQPRPGGPEGVREGKREKEQIRPDQQGKPVGSPEEGRGGKQRIEQPQPVQREQLEQQPRPGGPDGGREGREAVKQPQPAAKPQPAKQKKLEQQPVPGAPGDGREIGGEGKKVQPSRPEQPAAQPRPERQKQVQPAAPPRPEKQKQVQPSAQPRPEKQKQVQPAAPPRPEKQKQVQPAQPVAPEVSPKAKGQGKPPQPEAPQCGPDQKDQFDPAKCPQNFPDNRNMKGPEHGQRKK